MSVFHVCYHPGIDAIRSMFLATIRYGDRMRASVKIEWSTARDN